MTKNEIRKDFLTKRKNISKSQKIINELKICQNIIKLPEFIESCHVAFYFADEFEVDLKSIFEEFCKDKSFYLPRFNKDKNSYEMVKVLDLNEDLIVGKYGLLEPKDNLCCANNDELKSMLFLVPGVAFDESCQRLGRGKGFYDRLLLTKKVSVGVFFEEQKSSLIPVEQHDIPMDIVVTECRIYKNLK